MNEPIVLSDSEFETIRNASRSLRYWRYGRWLQLALGIYLTLFSFWLINKNHGPGAWQGIPHYVFSAFGLMLLLEFFFSWRSREQRLLLKLHAAQGSSRQ